MSGVIIAGNTSGSVTLDAPAVSGSTVITLPTTSGTMLTNKSVGTVLQVVSSTPYTTVQSTTSATYSSTAVVASITPTSATSKILIKYTGQAYIDRNAGEALLAIYKNSVFLVGGTAIYSASAGFLTTSANIQYLDSPATTSTIEYRLYIKSNNGVAGVGINPNNGTDIASTIILMEIAA